MSTTPGILHTTPDVNLMLEMEFRVYDGWIAVGFWICFLIGLPGNCVALTYFLHTKKRNLSTLLYIFACSFDICSSVIHLPVAVNLLNKRRPGLLGIPVFCSMWHFTLLLLQQMAMFVVMLLSLSRAVVILFPFYQFNKRGVLLSIVLYLFYHCIWNTLYFTHADSYYGTATALCTIYSETAFNTIHQANYSLCSGLPPIIVFVAFLVSTAKLQRDNFSDASLRKNHYASVTITYFSAIFLCCNSFTFVNQSLYTFTMAWYKTYPGPIYNNNFMFFYSWLISQLFCTVLNASLNPMLYIWRITEMRMWILGLFSSDRSLICSG